MVRVYGPLFSLDASGTIAKGPVFSKWKGRNYVRVRVIPSNPQSGGQVGMRRMLRFLSQDWTNLLAAEKSSWEARAAQSTVSPFNAFISANMARWRNFLSPGINDPVGGTGAPGTYANFAATAGVRQITVDFDCTIVAETWGIHIFRGLTPGFATAWTNHVQTIRALTVDSFAWIDTPLVPDQYYYNFRSFTTDGLVSGELGEVNAIVV